MQITLLERLSAPFDPALVSWRVGQTNERFRKGDDPLKGKALAYIDARDVMGRLDEVVGCENWMDRYPHANGKTVCDIGIRVERDDDAMPWEWVWKADGAGDTDVEAEKGALSDAFKRAAVRWGIGRYLYSIPSPWVALDERKQITDAGHKHLEELLAKYTSEFEWGSPEDRATLRVLSATIKTTIQTADDVRLYREANAGMFPLLRVKAREHVETLLAQIEEGARAKAA